MALPSFTGDWVNGNRTKPRIQVLEIRDPKQPEGEPVAWLLVEREEHFERWDRDNTIHKASIRLSYEEILPRPSLRDRRRGSFDGSYSKLFNSVSLTSSSTDRGAVFLDLAGLEGHRIGTYLMNEIVAWVRQWPEAAVNTIHLRSEQAVGENTERRNRFYERFGIEFDYSDPEHHAGHSKPMQASALKPVNSWEKNITEHSMFDYLGGVLYAREKAVNQVADKVRAIEYLKDTLAQAEAHPVRWALKVLFYQYAGVAGGIAILSLFAWGMLKQFNG